MAATLERKYASLHDVAEHFGISERTVRRMIADGELSAIRIARSTIRIPITELERLNGSRPIGNAGAV